MPSAPDPSHRYARQLALPEIGADGQALLRTKRVLVVGAGGLGSPAAYYLAAAGIGTLGLADDDTVDASNLQRQLLHFTPDLGRSKVQSATEKLSALNPEIRLRAHRLRLTAANAAGVIGDYDFVVEATDNFDAKGIVADACHATRIPCCHGGILRFFGQILTVLPGRTACYRCVFDNPPDDPAEPQGPLGALPGVIGSLQALEALKLLLGIGTPLVNRLLTFDALALRFREIPVNRDPRCRLCGQPAGTGIKK